MILVGFRRSRVDSQALLHPRFLTRGAVSVLPGDLGGVPFMAPLWGLCRAARAERPDLKLSVVDLDDVQQVGAQHLSGGFRVRPRSCRAAKRSWRCAWER